MAEEIAGKAFRSEVDSRNKVKKIYEAKGIATKISFGAKAEQTHKEIFVEMSFALLKK